MDQLLGHLGEERALAEAAVSFCAVVARKPIPTWLLLLHLAGKEPGAGLAPSPRSLPPPPPALCQTPPGSPRGAASPTPPKRRKRARLTLPLAAALDKENVTPQPTRRRPSPTADRSPQTAAMHALDECAAAGLLAPTTDGLGATMPPAARDAVLEALGAAAVVEATAGEALEACASALAAWSAEDPSSWPPAREAAPHARAAALHPGVAPARAAAVLAVVGDVELTSEADPDRADETLVAAVVLAEQAHGRCSPELLRPMRTLIHAHRLREHRDKERALLRRAMRLWPRDGLLMGDMGASLSKGSPAELEQALGWLRRAEERVPAGSLAHATLLCTAGRVLRRQGLADLAVQRFCAALSELETSVGPSHPAVAGVLRQLSACARTAGDADGERDLLLRALQLDETHFGRTHMMLVGTVTRLAELLPGEASTAMRVRLDELAAAASTPADAGMRSAVRHIAQMLGMGDAHGALQLGRQVAARAAEAGDELSVEAHCRVLHTLARVELQHGHAEPATRVLRRLEELELRRRPWHRETAKVFFLRGVAADASSVERAQSFERALEVMDAQPYGLDDKLTDNVLYSLADTYLHLGRVEDALATARRDAALAARVHGPRNAELLPVKRLLASALCQAKDVQAAKAVLDDAVLLACETGASEIVVGEILREMEVMRLA